VTAEHWEKLHQLRLSGQRAALSADASQVRTMRKDVKDKISALPEDLPDRESEAFEIKAGAFFNRQCQVEIQLPGKRKTPLRQKSCLKNTLKTATRVGCLPQKVAPALLPILLGEPALNPAQVKQEKQDRKKADQKRDKA